MIVARENMEDLNSVYFHDCAFSGFTFDYKHRKVNMSCVDPYYEVGYDLEFLCVIYLVSQNCRLWGNGNSIMCAYVDQECAEYAQLCALTNTQDGTLKFSEQGHEKSFIPFRVELNSGDTFLIICEKISITKTHTSTRGRLTRTGDGFHAPN